MTADDRLAGVVQKRSKLGHAMQQVELAAAAAAGKESWTADLLKRLRKLESVWAEHIAEAEAPMGLHDRILGEAPRLQRSVEAIQLDHRTIASSIAEAVGTTANAGDDADKEELRVMAMEVLLALARHRQHGADLIFQAYSIDIGGY